MILLLFNSVTINLFNPQWARATFMSILLLRILGGIDIGYSSRSFEGKRINA